MRITNLKPLISEEAIQTRVKEMAGEISTLYKDEPLVVVCVLKGAFMFFSDLVRHLTCKPELDFVRLASYGSAAQRSKTITFTKDVEIPLEGKHVLIVEDIVDTGHSMDFLYRQFQARGARSLRRKMQTLLEGPAAELLLRCPQTHALRARWAAGSVAVEIADGGDA